jgi:cytochrome oxidase assembly protein ShyY1
MRRFVTITALALALIFGCFQGALWQYDRYQVRHANNDLIRNNVAKTLISESSLSSSKESEIAWRRIELVGAFDPSKEFLIRNRYHEGKYGFGVVTLFKSESGKKYWVDRGWVIAGKDAQTPPSVQKITNEKVQITAHVRVQDIESQVQGSVFAIPGSNSTPKLTKWNVDQSVATEPNYFDLISSSNPAFTPDVPTPLPELSDGPHLAYSFQWILFIFLVAFAWYLVIREDRKAQTVKL